MSMYPHPATTTSDSKVAYLKLDPSIEKAIAEDLAHHKQSPYAFPDENVLRREDTVHDRATLLRPAFARDIEKILNIPAYSRYADKTQVFSFVENDDITRRSLHVQLVSRIARNIGRLLGLNVELIEAIALGHDVGHTPFGHAGERFLSEVYHQHTGRYFNHNVHSVRVLDALYRRNMSLQTLNGVLCHNGEFACQKLNLAPMDNFEALEEKTEACMVDQQVIKTLRPSTLEGCVVRVSDMIAYIGKDRIDAINMGVLDGHDPFHSEVLGTRNTQILSNATVDIINNSYGKDYIAMSEAVYQDLSLAKRQNYELIYEREGLTDEAKNIVQEMFEAMYKKLREDLISENRESPIYRHHVKYLSEQSYSLSEEDYLATDADQIVVDYMASMTDSYFMALYESLFAVNSLTDLTKHYCSDLR